MVAIFQDNSEEKELSVSTDLQKHGLTFKEDALSLLTLSQTTEKLLRGDSV